MGVQTHDPLESIYLRGADYLYDGEGRAENYYGNACPDAGLARDGQRDAIPLKPIAVAVSGGTVGGTTAPVEQLVPR